MNLKKRVPFLIGNIVIYAIAYGVFFEQWLQFFFLSIALLIVNDIYILVCKK